MYRPSKSLAKRFKYSALGIKTTFVIFPDLSPLNLSKNDRFLLSKLKLAVILRQDVEYCQFSVSANDSNKKWWRVGNGRLTVLPTDQEFE